MFCAVITIMAMQYATAGNAVWRALAVSVVVPTLRVTAVYSSSRRGGKVAHWADATGS